MNILSLLGQNVVLTAVIAQVHQRIVESRIGARGAQNLQVWRVGVCVLFLVHALDVVVYFLVRVGCKFDIVA